MRCRGPFCRSLFILAVLRETAGPFQFTSAVDWDVRGQGAGACRDPSTGAVAHEIEHRDKVRKPSFQPSDKLSPPMLKKLVDNPWMLLYARCQIAAQTGFDRVCLFFGQFNAVWVHFGVTRHAPLGFGSMAMHQIRVNAPPFGGWKPLTDPVSWDPCTVQSITRYPTPIRQRLPWGKAQVG